MRHEGRGESGRAEDGRHKATIFSRLLTFRHYLELEHRGLMCSRGKSSFGGQEDVFPPQRRDSGFIWNLKIPAIGRNEPDVVPELSRRNFNFANFQHRREHSTTFYIYLHIYVNL